MTNDPSPLRIGEALAVCVQAFGLEDLLPTASLDQASREIEIELLSVATDAHKAEVRGVRLATAARDFEGFPALAALHQAFDDVLTMKLPPPLERWAREFLSTPPPDILDGITGALVSTARSDPMPLRRALCRVLVFECVRLQLVLQLRWFPDETYTVGMLDADADTLAENEVANWFSQPLVDQLVERPLHAIMCSALEEFTHRAELLRHAIRHLKSDFREDLDRRARWEQALTSLDASDAILVRNEVAPALEEQRLTLDRLIARHRVVFDGVSRGALDQRLTRLRRKLAKGGADILRSKRPRMLDLIHDAESRLSLGNGETT